MSTELVKISRDDRGKPVVYGRELHAALEVETPYDKWFPRMVEYGFETEKDFSTFLSESTGGRPSTDHALSLDMAKHLAMIQRTEKGKQVRQYFIECEAAYREQTYVDSIRFTADQIVEAVRVGKIYRDRDEHLAFDTDHPNHWPTWFRRVSDSGDKAELRRLVEKCLRCGTKRRERCVEVPADAARRERFPTVPIGSIRRHEREKPVGDRSLSDIFDMIPNERTKRRLTHGRGDS